MKLNNMQPNEKTVNQEITIDKLCKLTTEPRSPDNEDRGISAFEGGDFMLGLYLCDDYLLELYELRSFQPAGSRNFIGYRFYDDRYARSHSLSSFQPLFEGRDFGVAAQDAIDSAQAMSDLLAFLSTKGEDTDAEYFDKYSKLQLNWRDSRAESLQLWVMEFSEMASQSNGVIPKWACTAYQQDARHDWRDCLWCQTHYQRISFHENPYSPSHVLLTCVGATGVKKHVGMFELPMDRFPENAAASMEQAITRLRVEYLDDWNFDDVIKILVEEGYDWVPLSICEDRTNTDTGPTLFCV